MTAPLWNRQELIAATGGQLAAEVAVQRVVFDSRQVSPGDLFVALRAARDGHAFVADAFAAGAACAMVEHGEDPRCLIVPDTLTGLRALAAAGRARSSARVVAVTGSVGKTTVKEMLRLALGAFGPTHAAAASFNNHIGVPTTLANLPPAAAFAAVEIGMNSRGEIAPLARLVRPHVAIITTIGTAHLGRLGSRARIAEEKGDILLGLEAAGVAVLPADNDFFPALRARAACALSFGEGPKADLRLLDWREAADSGEGRIATPAGEVALHLPLPGRHLALNACAVLAAVVALGLDPAAAAAALAAFAAGPGRGQRRRIALPGGGSFLLLDESYNASDSSLRATLAVLAAQPGRRIAVLGDMLELGEEGAAMHRALAPAVAAAADLVYVCGPLMSGLFAELPAAKRGAAMPDAESLAPLLSAALRPGDVVLVKGSLGMRMASIIQALDRPA
ncbi:MAG: UDP-N-acetylmuramoyl-tripeptide--D-alanyl-D-alanine ligase [Rhodovarius sp.]|nr:UDP-N-acetylmuramoyl-tripeptide--D-alanyl-D-alanine ligase [Rhodovarius sp.]